MLNWLLKIITKLTVAGGRYKNDQNWGYVKRAQSKGVRTIIHNLVHEVSMSLNNLQRSRAKRLLGPHLPSNVVSLFPLIEEEDRKGDRSSQRR